MQIRMILIGSDPLRHPAQMNFFIPMAGLLTCGVCQSAPSQAIARWQVQTIRTLTVSRGVTELRQRARTVFPFKPLLSGAGYHLITALLLEFTWQSRKKEFCDLILNLKEAC